MNDFLEKRKKQLEERKTQGVQVASDNNTATDFLSRRKQQLADRQKISERTTGTVAPDEDLVKGFEKYVKTRTQARPAKSVTPGTRQTSDNHLSFLDRIKMAAPEQAWDVPDVEKLGKNYVPEGSETPQKGLKDFEAFRTAEDFAELSAKGKTMRHGLSDQPYVGNETGYFLKSYNTYYLTPEERELHNYILANEGEEGAKAYLDFMDETMNQRASGKWKEAAESIGRDMPVRGTAYNAFLSAAAAPTGILYALAQNVAGENVDMNSPRFQGSRMEAATREGIKENEIPVVGKNASDFLIDTGLSMTQNLARLPLGAAGLAVAGAGAATGGYLDAKDRGASEAQALLAGTAQGAAEAFFEKYSLEGLKTLKAGSATSARELFKNIGKQAFTEGTEEMFTEFANYASDRVIMGALSNYELSLQDYMEQGLSEKEAKENAYADLVKNLLLAGAGGALSGGIMGGGAQALGTYLNGQNSTTEDYREYVDSIETDESAFENHEEYETAQTLRNLAAEMVEKQQAGKDLTAMEKGYFENAVNDMAVQAQEKATVEAKGAAEDTQTDISSPEQEKGSSVAHSKPQEHIFGELTEEFGENGRAVIEEMSDDSIDAPGYFRAFSRYYNAGRYDMDMSDADRFASSALLTEAQAKAAFKAGAQDRNMEIGYDPATGEMKGMQQGQAKTGGLGYAAPTATEAQKKVASALGKRTGLRFEIVDDSDTEGEVASYTPGVIRIATSAKNFNSAVSHELTHFIKDYSADMYQLYEDTAVKAITRAEGIDIESMLDRYISRYEEAGQKLTRSQAMEEIVADATEKFFNDPDYIDSIVKENRTLGEKILDFLDDMIDALKSLMKSGSTRQAAKALEQNLELYERARTYWMQGLQEAGDRYREGWEKTGKNEKFQLKDPGQVTEEQIEKNYDIVRSMKPVITLRGDEFTRRDIKISEQIIDFYNSLGNVVHNEVVGDILLNKRSAKDDIAHGVGRLKSITFKAVPSVLENGKILQYQKNWKGRSYDTVTIGARVDVTGGERAGEYYVVCIVKVDETNRMYLHEVHARKMDAPSPFWTGGDQRIVLPGEDAHPSTNSIIDNGKSVNKMDEIQGTKTDGSMPFKTWTVENDLPSGDTPSISSVFDKLQGVNKNDGNQVRFQLEDPTEDSAGNKLTAGQQEFFKDSKVRDADGKLKVMYHGSPNEFTVFDRRKARSSGYYGRGFYFADSSNQAGVYGKNYEVYLNIKAPLQPGDHMITKPQFKKFVQAVANDEDYGIDNYGYDASVEGVVRDVYGKDDFSMLMDINASCVGDMVETVRLFNQANGTLYDGIIAPTETVAFEANQIKKIDNKNPTSDPDIRFQLEDVDDHQEAMADLIKENQELKEANEHLKKQFELTSKEALRQSDVDRVARDILTKYGSNCKKQTLMNNLTRLYEYIRSADVDPSELSQVAGDIGRSILKNSTQVDNTLAEQYKEMRKKIKDTKISISDQDKKDLAAVGGYNSFRKKYFGRMKLGNGGISVDSLYEELAGEVPEMFDLDITHPADRLQQIGNFLDITQPQVRNPYHANMDEMAYLVGQEILEAYTTIRNPPATMADRYEAKYQKARDDYRRKIQEYKDKTVTQYDAILADKNRELGLIKDNHERDLLVQKEKYEHKMQQRRDSLTKREAKNRIIKEVTAMQKWLLEPTDTKHIPQELRGVVANFLSNIDFSSKDDYSGVVTQRTQAWRDAKDAFEKIKNTAGTIVDDEGNTVYIDVDPDMAARIEELGKKVDGIEKLEDLDVYSMEELKKTVISMKKALTEINQMKSNARYRQMSILAEDVFRDTENLRNSTEYTKAVGKGNKLMNYDMLDPQTMFGKIGPAFKTTYDSLRKGLDKKTIRLKEAEDYFNKALEESGISRSDVRKWTGTNAPTHTFDVAGKKIEMSIPQIMSLYELDKRGQARKHMYDRNGGIKPDDLKLGISLDNKSAHIPQKKRSYAPVRVNRELVRQITSVLTSEQKKLADALQRFMGDQVSQWGNETSMEMYGYEKFTAKDYFPIVTDKNYIMQPEGTDRGKASIRNLGITKSVNKYANNPLIIEDIFEVFTRQVDQMSSYNAYVLPLSDLHKVMNYKDMRGFNGSSIKEELTRTFGKAGVDYINKLVDDINGSVRHESDLGDILISNMKAASVAGNLRVVVQQPTSIARAAAEIDLKYLAQGVAKIEDGRWEKIVKYAPIAQWKDWGFYQMQTSRAMKDVLVGSDSAKQRLVNKTMFLAEMGDKIAWNRLWSSCELETSDKYPNLENGSEEFYRRVGERFSEVVDKTQVVDSVLHRTQIMRKKDLYNKMLTSFMGEPLKSYNMLYRAFYDAKMNRPGATKKLSASAAAYIASGFLTAVAASFIDAIRDDDRKKTYADKYKESFWDNIKDNFNVLNMLPYIKDLVSIASGYTISRTDMGGFQDLFYAYKKIESWKKGDSPYTPQHLLLNTAQSVSKLTSLPVKNITRDAVAIVDTAFNITGGEADYKWLKLTYNLQNNKKMYVEMLMQAEDIGNKKLADQIRDDLIEIGMTEDDIADKMNDVVNQIIKEEVNLNGAIQEYDATRKESKEYFAAEVQAYINLKMRAGWDKEKCITEIRKKITAVYKPLWQQAATQSERDAIIKKCKSFYYGGNSIYKDYNFTKNWKKE